jgi:hypothetical protein
MLALLGLHVTQTLLAPLLLPPNTILIYAHWPQVNEGTQGVELKLTGEGPWTLHSHPGAVPGPVSTADGTAAVTTKSSTTTTASSISSSTVNDGSSSSLPTMTPMTHGHTDINDITLILTPGHTEAHVCLYYHPQRTLFSGDHLSSPFAMKEPHKLFMYKKFNW